MSKKVFIYKEYHCGGGTDEYDLDDDIDLDAWASDYEENTLDETWKSYSIYVDGELFTDSSLGPGNDMERCPDCEDDE